jgi:hypothetical integral membrane protein (TIGR02206 family)
MPSPPIALFSPPHLIALVTVLVLASVSLLALNRFRDSIEFQRWHGWLALLLVINAVYWKFSVVIQNNLPLAVNLPLHLCGIAPYLLAIYLVRPSQKLFDVLYYWIMVGFGAALLLPDFLEDEFVGFFFLHGLPLFVMVYLLLFQEVRPSRGSYWIAFLWLNIYTFMIAAPVDMFTGANFVFLREPPSVNFGPIKLLPPWPWYIPVIDLFMLLIYRVLYQPFSSQSEKGVSIAVGASAGKETGKSKQAS